MRVWKERFELLDSTIAPTQTPIDLVDQYHDTPRLRESRSFDADEQYWYISFDVVISVLVCCAALLIFYGVYVYTRKHCWRCQRAVEGSEQRQCCHTGRDASRAQRVGLVVWLVVAVVVFAVLTCVEIKMLRRVRAESSRRPPRHRRDAGSMAWRCRFLQLERARTAASSPRNDLVKNYQVHPTHS